ncbi:MAG: hypothetical protein IKI63_05140 [Clostridia bacterium]|nr:hypothetical protein [Clostridia bacterium]
MKRWLAALCLIGLLISPCAIGTTTSADSNAPLLGDPDGDGIVSMKDVLVVRRFIAHQGDLSLPTAADVNADGSVDMRDVLLIRKFIAHRINSFDAAPPGWQHELSSLLPFYRSGFEQLTDAEKAAYTEVVNAVEANLNEETTARDGSLGLTVPFGAPLPTEDAVSHVFRALYADHPEFYFLNNQFSYTRTREGQVTSLSLSYFMNMPQRKKAEPELIRAIDAWMQELGTEDTDVERELALHDWLCTRCTYPEGDGPYPDAYYSPYGALVLKSAVCEGYARTLQLLCLAAGLPATVVEGFSASGQAHMWNVIYLDGDPYFVDPTWDDLSLGLTHTYFNVTAADIARSHTLNFDFPKPPTCTATRYNYYYHFKKYVTTDDGEAFGKLVLAAYQNGDALAEVRFAPDVMPANRYITESGRLGTIVSDLLPPDTSSFTGYLYSFFDSAHVIVVAFDSAPRTQKSP